MKIKSLTLHGFKSFADKTQIVLHEGITAIVGPNGCGKSNISDALRWVLGEQRPTAIRGARMEEAIFGGTAERRPIHRAEVTLEIANEDKTLPVPYAEVAIGRTVYRGGESEYALNSAPCRLRDILDLCRDTGLGANAYSIIEGRMIDAILSDRAEERRALFEEAAEIGRYKDRRRTALRRLEQAEGDLSRLDDVIGEVQSKVRSLARQRGRAERYLEYRERRLQLEIAVEESRLEEIARRLETISREREELEKSRSAETAELAAQEERAQLLRAEISEREGALAALAQHLDEARGRLDEIERQRLVAAERSAAAERRTAGIDEELEAIDGRRQELEVELSQLSGAAERQRAEAVGLREQLDAANRSVDELRSIRKERKSEEEELQTRLTALVRQASVLEAERESAVSRIAEREAELEQRRQEVKRLEDEEARHEQEHGEASDMAARAAARLAELEFELEAAQASMSGCRERLRTRREEIAALEGTLSTDRARASSLAALLASGQDLPARVAELLEQRGALPGLHGVLADYIQVSSHAARAVESHLGSYLYGLVVEDWDSVRAVRAWLADQDEPDGVVLLPLEPGPHSRSDQDSAADGQLADRVEVEGAGVAWARALLGGVASPEADAADAFRPAAEPWVLPDGSGQDRWGAVRLGQPGAGRGILSRRAELSELRDRIRAAEGSLDELQQLLERDGVELRGHLETVDRLEGEVTRAARENRELQARRESAEERVTRARSEREDVAGRIERLIAILDEARSGAEALETRLGEVTTERGETEAALGSAHGRAVDSTVEWETASSSLHELQLHLARQEATAGGAEERLQRARITLSDLALRRERLDAERAGLAGEVAEGRGTLDESAGSLGDLMQGKTRLEAEVQTSHEVLDERKADIERVEEWLGTARVAERERSERRHSLELETTELRGNQTNIRERLEAEWDTPLEELQKRAEAPEDGDLEEWAEELEVLRDKLGRIGPVNLLAAEEFEEQKHRLEFLTTQRGDLVAAGQDLHASIRRINESASAAFYETFEQIRDNFRNIFVSLFQGGECDLWLTEPDDPLDSPIEISASPRGKRTQRLHLLSGGERALTALALLFGIYLTKPSPFCVMDEVDAPLDEQNVRRFTAMLERFKADTQFIIVTHNPRTIEAADWIYGVTMQEPGVSSVVGVEFGELPAGQVA